MAFWVSSMGRLLRVMHRAGWLRANLSQFALVDAVRHDGFGCVFACLELRSLLLWSWVSLAGFLCTCCGQRGVAHLLVRVGRADLHELGLHGNSLDNVGIDLGVVTVRVGASVLPYVRKYQLAIAG